MYYWIWLLFLTSGGFNLAARAQSHPPVYPISVLVLYTPQAAAGAGGVAALNAQIKEAFHEANVVFQNSEVNARVWLAQAVSVNYVESGSVSNDLACLRDPTTSLGVQAQTLRNEYAADLVCLVTETGNDYNFYGLQGPSAENAFSILRQPYLSGLNCFPVALSFNFGCQLERPFANSAAALPYAYGYTFWDSVAGTFYGTVEAFYGERLPFFSNPNILYDGVPAGVPAGEINAADNALALNQTAPIVAAFRGTAVTVPTPSVSLAYPPDGNVFDSGTNLFLVATTSFPDTTLERVDYYFDETNLIASIGGTYFTAVWRNVPAGQHVLTAVATDKNHATTVSAPVSITVLPGNDYFAQRFLLTTITTNIDEANNLATAELGEPNNNGTPPMHSLWWTWKPATNTYVAISTPSNGIPLNLSVYTGTNLANLSIVVANTFQPGSPLAVFFRAAAGMSYQITADGQYGGTGAVAFNLASVPGPANDDFANRTPLTGNSIEVDADNTYATREPGEPYHAGYPGDASLWWSWTAPADGQITLTDVSGSGSLLTGVYTGDTLTNLTPVASGVLYGPGYDVVCPVQAGVTYQIAFDNNLYYYPETGPFTFDLDFVTAPANDDFANRTVISGSNITLTNSSVLATLEPNEPVHSYSPYYGDSSIWWSWTAPASGTVTLSSPDNVLDAYTGNSLATLVPQILNYYSQEFSAVKGMTYAISASGPQGEVVMSLVLSTMQFTSPANGRTYTVGKGITLAVGTTTNDGNISQVEYFANGAPIGVVAAPFRMTWTPTMAGSNVLQAMATDNLGNQRSAPSITINVDFLPPANDDFANRATLQGTWLQVTNSNLGATLEPGEPSYDYSYYYYDWTDSLWWQWTAPISGTVTLSSITSDMFAVYTGNSLSNLTAVADGWEPSFTATAGTTYDIGAVGPAGNVVLKLSLSDLQITSPTNGASFTNNSTLNLQILATANEEPVSEVEYFANGNSIGTTTNAPWSLVWTNVPGANYALTAVAIDNWGHDYSAPAVNISVNPMNDDFANRTELEGNWISVTNSTANATFEPGEPTWGSFYSGGSLWWQWTAPASGWAALSAAGPFPEYPVGVGAFTGNSVSNLQQIAAGYATIGFAAQAGVAYDISVATPADPVSLQLVLSSVRIDSPTDDEQVVAGTNLLVSADVSGVEQPVSHVEFFYNNGSYQGPSPLGVATAPPFCLVWTNVPAGNFNLTAVATDSQGEQLPSPPVSIVVVPPNDNFSNRITLTGADFIVSSSTANATTEPGEPGGSGDGYGTDHSVWYTWTAPLSTDYFFSIDNIDTHLILYTGNSVGNLVALEEGPNGGYALAAGTTLQIQIDDSYTFDYDFTMSLTSPPVNDDFSAAIPVSGTNTTVTGDNALATAEPGEPAPPYGQDNSVWYSWTGATGGSLTITPASAGSFPLVEIYTGDSVSNLTQVATGRAFEYYGTNATFAVTPGVTYHIAVTQSSAPFSLNFNFTAAPGNDFFANQTPLTGMSLSVTGTTQNATSEPGEPDPFGNGGISVWYAWTAPTNGFVRIQSPQTSYTYLAVFSGDNISNLTTVAVGEFGSEADFTAVAGQTYPISVVKFPDDSAYAFTWSLAVSKVVITNPVAGTVRPAGTNLDVETSTIDLDGAVTSVTFYAQDDGSALGTVTNRPLDLLLTNMPAGDYVLYAVATDEFGGTSTSQNVEFRVSPTNDNFAQRFDVAGTNFTLSGDNSGATSEPGEYLPPGATGRTIWWSWTAPVSGLLTISDPTYFDYSLPDGGDGTVDIDIIAPLYPEINPLVALYAGSTVTNLTLFTVNFATNFYTEPYTGSPYTFPVTGGQTYQISLDGFNGAYGPMAENFSFAPFPPPPPNDDFADRTVLSGGNVSTNGTIGGATLEATDPDLGYGLDARTVWYSWTAPASGTTQIYIFSDHALDGFFSNEFTPTLEFGIYAGSSPGNLITITSGSGYDFETWFYALAGTTYQIEVADPIEHEDDFMLSISGPTPPELSPTNIVRLANGSYDIHVVGTVGESFVIQSSLNGLTWTTIDTDTLQATSLDYIDTSAIGGPARSYRVLALDSVLNDQPFRLLAPTAGPANGFSLNLTGVSGQPFLIQSSTNLVNWYDLTSGIITNNAFNFTDYNAPNVPNQFYRAIPQ